MRDHPIIEQLCRDGDGSSRCDRCNNYAVFFDGRYQLCEECAEEMIDGMTLRQKMEAMGWDV